MRPEVLVALEAVYKKGRIAATRCKTLTECIHNVNRQCRRMCETLNTRITGIDPKICFIHCLAGASELLYAPGGQWSRDAARILKAMANFRMKRVDSSLDFGEDYPCLFSIARHYKNLAIHLQRMVQCYYLGECTPRMIRIREMVERAAASPESREAEEIVEEVLDAILGVGGEDGEEGEP